MAKFIFVSGPPGSGKSTQARLINDKLEYQYFDSGDMVRRYLDEGKMTGIERMKKGLLMPIESVLIMAKKELEKILEENPSGVVISGIPRSVQQAFGANDEEGIIDWLSSKYGKSEMLFIELEIPEDESIRRNTNRNEGRVDDSIEVLPTRLKIYKDTTIPVFEELEKRGYKVVRVDGTPPPDEVFAKINTYLK